jgi:hypothetical protein
VTTLWGIQIMGRIVLGALWAALLASVLIWVFNWPMPFGIEPEPITVLLSTISPTVTALFAWVENRLKKQQAELEEERYSISHALAYGYVNNFLVPAAAQIASDHPQLAGEPSLYVYMPGTLGELEKESVQQVLARVRAKGFTTAPVQLVLKDSRPRDVLTISKEGSRPVYFDFPNTLLTLNSLVSYKLESQADSFDDAARAALGREYIRKFRREVERLIDNRGLRTVIGFTDDSLHFLNRTWPKPIKVDFPAISAFLGVQPQPGGIDGKDLVYRLQRPAGRIEISIEPDRSYASFEIYGQEVEPVFSAGVQCVSICVHNESPSKLAPHVCFALDGTSTLVSSISIGGPPDYRCDLTHMDF